MIKKVFSLLICLFLLATPLQAYKYKLSICTVFQNEAPYLKEWIEFHRLVGVEHFYLFNNLSTDHYREVLKPYIKAGIVELFDWPYEFKEWKEWDDIQVKALQKGWKKAYGKTKWLAFLDSDEFLFPTQCDSLVEFLKSFESMPHVGGICVNWVMYGTSNVAKIPDDKLLIEILVWSAGAGHNHFKSIVRPERVAQVCNPHYVEYRAGYGPYTPSGQKLQPPFVDIEKIRINHYWSRDEYYLNNVKIPRRIRWGTSLEECQLWSTMNNAHYDPAILRFVEPLRKKVFK
jgi:hypothetical protein